MHLLGLIGAVLLATCLACDRPPARRQAILILLDAARPDRMSAYGYQRATTPRLDALAAEGVVFRQHFAQGTDTRTTLPSLLYSRYYVPPLFPADARVPFAAPAELFRRADDQAIALPQALSEAGLTTAMISAHVWLREDSLFASTFDQAYDLSRHPRAQGQAGYPNVELAMDQALTWLEAHRDEDFFLYLHVMDTHFPHAYGDDAQHFLPPDQLDPTTREHFSETGTPRARQKPLSDAHRRYLDALYDGSLRYVDRHLGRLFDALDTWRSEVLVAVTADHGEHLLETPGRLLHGGPWLDAVARIPLILRYREALAPGSVEAMTESVDVLPTILGLLEIPLPAGVRPDGVDVRSHAADRPFVFTRGAVRSPDSKCLFNTPDAVLLAEQPPTLDTVRGTLYDVTNDPLETRNLWANRPEAAAACVDAYRRHMIRPHRRYQGAVRTTPPASPFALSATYFDAEPLPRMPLRALSARERDDSSWIRLVHRDRNFLAARAGAPEHQFALSLPNGRYALELGHRGTCRVAVGEQALTTVETRPFDPRQPRWNMRGSALGTVDVRQTTLPVRLAPTDGTELCVVGHLGFTPLNGTERTAEPDEERREQLRALGYLD